MPDEVIRTITSVGSWMVGSGCSSMRTSRRPCQVRAFMGLAAAPPAWALTAVLDPRLQPGGEAVEGRLQVRHRPPDERQQRTRALLANPVRRAPVAAGLERVGALAPEQPERHTAPEDHPARGLELGHRDRERAALIGLDLH